MKGRTWLGMAGAGSALFLAFEGHWVLASLVAALFVLVPVVVLPAARRMRAEFAATAEMLREVARPEPRPAPRPPKPGRQPWATMEMAVPEPQAGRSASLAATGSSRQQRGRFLVAGRRERETAERDAVTVNDRIAAAIFNELANQMDGAVAVSATVGKPVIQEAADLLREYARKAANGELADVPAGD